MITKHEHKLSKTGKVLYSNLTSFPGQSSTLTNNNYLFDKKNETFFHRVFFDCSHPSSRTRDKTAVLAQDKK
jgi:hypothetical protein